MKNLSNIELLKACAENAENQKAWIEFIKRFDRHVRRSILKAYKYLAATNLGKEIILKEEIRDLVQEVYIKLVKDSCRLLKDFNSEYNDSIYAYLALTSASVVKDHFRKFGTIKRKASNGFYQVRLNITEEMKLINKMMSSVIPSNPEKQIIAKDMLEKIKDYYSSNHSKRNNKKRGLIFQLYFLQGLSIKDISCIKGLNISSNYANTIIFRMKREIRNLILNDSFSAKAK